MASLYLVQPMDIIEESPIVFRDVSVPISYLASSRFTQPDQDLRDSVNPYIDNVDLEFVSENNLLELHVDPTNLAIYVYQKETDYWWSSTVFKDYAALDENDNPIYPELTNENDRGLRSTLWRNKVDSPVWIGYFGGSLESPQFREENIFDSSMSSFSFEKTLNGFSSNMYFAISEIEMTLEVSLSESGLVYEINPESFIEHDDENKLAEIAIYPFFGAAKRDVIPGYLMVPDGVGTLFRFDNYDGFESVYEKPFYGKDFAISQLSSDTSSTIISDQSLSANAYGMVHGIDQQGFLTIIDGSPSYANLVVYPPDVITDFFFAYTAYTIRSSYRQPLNQSQTNSVLRIQEDMNPVHIYQKTELIENSNANYVGMAQAYQSYLIARGDLKECNSDDIPMHLDILMSESKKAFIGRNTFEMTHINDVIELVQTLKFNGVEDIILTLRGTSTSGYSGTSLKELPVSASLGSISEFQALFDINGVTTQLYVEPTHLYEYSSQARRYDAAIGRHLLSYRFSDAYGTYDMIDPNDLLVAVEALKAEAIAFGFDGLALDTIGHTIYSSFGDTPVLRSEMQDAVSLLLQDQSVYMPYDFAFNATNLFHVISDHSMHAKMKDTVPFLTLALTGYKSMFGRFHNFFGNTQHELLRMIDFHLYPSFILSKESAYALLNSPSNMWYTTDMDIWQDEMIRQYNYLSSVYSLVSGETIVSRTVPEIGISLVTYSNGITLGINYLDVEVVYSGIRLNPLDVTVMEVPSDS